MKILTRAKAVPVTLLFSILAVHSEAQTGSGTSGIASTSSGTVLNWAQTWGGTSDDNANHVAVDAQGNSYVAGGFAGTVNFSTNPASPDYHTSHNGTIDASLSKFGPDGSFLWARTWGGGSVSSSGTFGRDIASGVAVDGSGNVYVCGNFQYSVDFNPAGGATGTSNAVTMNNCFLSKFDSNGNFLWVRTWGPSDGGSDAYNVAFDGSNNVYVVGDYSGRGCFFNNPSGQPPSDWHANHISAFGDYRYFDAYLAKYDSSGNFQWAKTWGGEGYDDGPGVAVDHSGNVYVAGMYASTNIDFDPAGSGVTNHPAHDSGYVVDIFLSKFDSGGNFKWVRTWGGQGTEDAAISVSVDGSNNVYLAGRFSSINCDFDPWGVPDIHTTQGSFDAFVSKLDTDGNFLWAKTWGGTGADDSDSVAVDLAGNVFVVGNFQNTVNFNTGSGTDNHNSNGQGDAFLSMFDTNGRFLWAKTWGGSGDDAAFHVTVDNQGHVFAAGEFQNTVNFDPGSGTNSHTSNGGYDAFVSKFTYEPPYAAWQAANFGLNAGNPAIAGALANPGADGMANLLKYGFNSNPNQPSAPPFKSIANGIRFNCNPNATDVNFAVESTTRLSSSNWITMASKTGTGNWTSISGISVTGTGSVSVSGSDPVPSRFWRVRITHP